MLRRMGFQLVTLGVAYVALLTGCSLLAGLVLGVTAQPAPVPPAATEPPLISTVAVLTQVPPPAPQATAVLAPTQPPPVPQATAAPTQPPAGAGGKCEVIHVVEAGETVAGLAKRYGTTVEAIASANDLETTASLKIGIQLVIPLCAPTP